MDELLCNQARAYGTRVTGEADVSALMLYEQLKEAIESIAKTVAHDESLSTLWYDPAGQPVVVEHIGYFHQSFIVFGGRAADGSAYTSLVPVHAVQLVLKKVKKEPGGARSSVRFIGHSVVPDLPAAS